MNSTNLSMLIEKCNGLQNVVFNSSLICLTVIIIPLQSFIIHVYLYSRRLMLTPINHMLCSLSITDILAAISLIFIVLGNLLKCRISTTIIKNVNIFGFILSNICLLSAVGHVLVLSSERYIFIEYALRYNDIVTKTRLWRCSFAIYIISVVILTIEVLLLLTYPGFKNIRGFVYLGVTIVIFCLIGFTSVQYSIIFYRTNKLIKTSNELESYQRKKQHKALITFFSMFVAFVVVCIPYYTLKTLTVFEVTNTPAFALLKDIFMFLRFSISLLNPLIYTLNKTDFRIACLNVLRRYFHCNVHYIDRRDDRADSKILMTTCV